MILRKNDQGVEKVFRSIEQTHGFNFPYQVGYNGDNPLQGDDKKHEIRHNDIVILGSDGLWDNVFDENVIEIVEPFLKDYDQIKDLDLVADLITKKAFELSKQENYMSPFAKGAQSHRYHFIGGKMDDITVVIGQVVLKDQQSSGPKDQ